MDLPSIVTEAQSLRATIRDLRSVILTDKERLERHEGELKGALLRLDELEAQAGFAFAAIREPAGEVQTASIYGGAVRVESAPSPFGEPEQVAAE